jgi:O-antigen/teichoic acid export membrane protein
MFKFNFLKTLNKYFSNLKWLFIEKTFSFITTISVGIYVARYLGPDKFGLLAYSVGFVGIFKSITKLGLDEIVTKELVKNIASKNILLGTSFILKSLGILTSWFFIGLYLYFFQSDLQSTILIIIICGGNVLNGFTAINFYFDSRVKSKYSVLSRSVSGIVIPIVKILLVVNKYTLIWFAVVILVESLLNGLFLILIFKYKRYSIFDWKFNLGVAKKLLKDSAPMILSGIMIAIYMKIDQVMLKNIMDPTQVGIYAIAVRLSEFWYFIPVLICKTFFPAIINSNRGEINNRMGNLYNLMTFLSIIIIITVSIFSDLVVSTLYGSDYYASSNVLKIHVWSCFAVFLSVARGRWIMMKNYQKKILNINIIGAVLNVLLNYILIPNHGAEGAAFATTISYTLSFVIAGVFIKSFRQQFSLSLSSLLNFFTFKILRDLLMNKIK